MTKKEQKQNLDQQQLTSEAQLIEEAKVFATMISNNPEAIQIELMQKQFPDLSRVKIQAILEKP